MDPMIADKPEPANQEVFVRNANGCFAAMTGTAVPRSIHGSAGYVRAVDRCVEDVLIEAPLRGDSFTLRHSTCAYT